MKKRLLGLWNIDIFPFRIGQILFFAEELSVQAHIYQVQSVDICLFSKKKSSAAQTKAVRSFLNLLLAFKHINKIYKKTAAMLPTFIANYHYTVWPAVNTLGIQQFYKENRYIPLLSMKEPYLTWAVEIIKHHVYPRIPVTIHLKKSYTDSLSNADIGEWRSFFEVCAKNFNKFLFLLIGNDPLGNAFSSLPNVRRTLEFDSNIIKDLALIQRSYLFMGMASGPCNIAIFSRVPYIIYKDPNHHKKEMEKELGKKNYFLFADSHQRFLRQVHTKESLLSEFLKVRNAISTDSFWRRQP